VVLQVRPEKLAVQEPLAGPPVFFRVYTDVVIGLDTVCINIPLSVIEAPPFELIVPPPVMVV
jgi:hypothetical protein